VFWFLYKSDNKKCDLVFLSKNDRTQNVFCFYIKVREHKMCVLVFYIKVTEHKMCVLYKIDRTQCVFWFLYKSDRTQNVFYIKVT